MPKLTEAQREWMREHTNFEIVQTGVTYDVMAELYGNGRVSRIVNGRPESKPGPNMVMVGAPSKGTSEKEAWRWT